MSTDSLKKSLEVGWQGDIVYIEYNGGFCPGGFVQGDFVRGDFVQGDFVRGILSGGFCLGGFCPRTVLNMVPHSTATGLHLAA